MPVPSMAEIQLQIDQLHGDRPTTSGCQLVLGHPLELRLEKPGAGVETRLFLRHDAILYPQPLRDWSPDSTFSFLPESPGHYELLIHWRQGAGASGTTRLGFEVSPRTAGDAVPTLVQLASGARLWAPSAWEGTILDAEQATVELLRELVAADTVIYDVGANLGRYAIELARLVERGRVICFEANPVCVQYLRANVEENRASNVEILPVALLDRQGSVPFRINYANANLGLPQDSRFFDAKAGHQVAVPSFPLDDLVERFDLPAPGLIKLDVEGAEVAVLRGMARTLERHGPDLALELHGLDNAAAALALLDRLGYRYRHAESGRQLQNVEEMAELGPVFQLVARREGQSETWPS